MLQDTAVDAAFLSNHAGEFCIALSDPAFVQSDSIVVDRSTLHVFAIFHEAAHFIGAMPAGMANVFSKHEHVLLSAKRGDGTIFELKAPITARESNACFCKTEH